ncbi:MAG: patatin-like phospholipase family protein [Elusimicrobia bacterium]|nr:patatin-like phospholipase family protein [Elusimicrobiota bacterium]
MKFAGLLLALLLPAQALRAAPDYSPDGLLRAHLWRDLSSRPAGRRPRVGVVLSAGSTRGTAHVGVLQVLDQAGFPVDSVAGTSMGAVIGSLYAAGRPVKRIWEIMAGLNFGLGTNFNSFRLIQLMLADKLLSSENTEKLIRGEIGGLRFDQMPIPFACVAMDIYTGESVLFREGDVATAVRASMNLPGVFEPVAYRQRYLVDGGVVDYIPIDAARMQGAQWVLASITESDYRSARPQTVLEMFEQVIDIRGALLSREQRKLAQFVIAPQVGDIGVTETARAPEAMSKGVIAAYKALRPAMENLLLFSLESMARDWVSAPSEARP